MACPTTLEALIDYREKRADAATALQVETHLASGCSECLARMEWLEDFESALDSTLATVEPQPSPSAVEFVRSLARRAPAGEARQLTGSARSAAPSPSPESQPPVAGFPTINPPPASLERPGPLPCSSPEEVLRSAGPTVVAKIGGKGSA